MEFLNYQIAAVLIILGAVSYTAFIKPFLDKKKWLNTEAIALIDYACGRAVGYAEQLYKSDRAVDRQKLALDFAFDVIEEAGIIPDMYYSIILGIIEDKVRQLPKTHDEYDY